MPVMPAKFNIRACAMLCQCTQRLHQQLRYSDLATRDILTMPEEEAHQICRPTQQCGHHVCGYEAVNLIDIFHNDGIAFEVAITKADVVTAGLPECRPSVAPHPQPLQNVSCIYDDVFVADYGPRRVRYFVFLDIWRILIAPYISAGNFCAVRVPCP